MSNAALAKAEQSKLDSLISIRLQRIEELKKLLRNELSMDEERELLRNLSNEVRELLKFQKRFYQNT